MSIKPEFAYGILGGQKQVEFRKTRPSFGQGTRVVIYASAPVHRIVGVFEVASVEAGAPTTLWRRFSRVAGAPRRSVLGYFGDASVGYGIVVAWARIIRPRPLPRGKRPTQTWQFLGRGKLSHRELRGIASH